MLWRQLKRYYSSYTHQGNFHQKENYLLLESFCYHLRLGYKTFSVESMPVRTGKIDRKADRHQKRRHRERIQIDVPKRKQAENAEANREDGEDRRDDGQNVRNEEEANDRRTAERRRHTSVDRSVDCDRLIDLKKHRHSKAFIYFQNIFCLLAFGFLLTNGV